MQRGTALRWVRALRATNAAFDAAQLGYEARGAVFRCPFGVLLDEIGPDQWSLGWDGMSHLWRGEQFSLPDDFRKRARMKTDGREIMAAFASMGGFHDARRYVARNYRTM